MKIVFDPDKDAINRQKHGLSLAEAEWLDWRIAVTYQDIPVDYGEQRMIGLVPFRQRLHQVVYVDRMDIRRIISFRIASKKKLGIYEQGRHRN